MSAVAARRAKLLAPALLVAFASPAFAHRLDEYLQATMLSVEKDRVRTHMRLAPGVAVAGLVLAAIDRDADGAISPGELHAYAARVLRDLSLTIDGTPAPLRLIASTAAAVDEMREGRGEIRLELEADVPHGSGGPRRLRFENRHQSRIAAYLVNCLVPSDPAIRVTAQSRNYDQSVYELDYAEPADSSRAPRVGRSAWVGGWLGVALLLCARTGWRRWSRRPEAARLAVSGGFQRSFTAP